MITEDYVSFETAKLLKEKGFDEEVLGYYHIWDRKINPPVWDAGTYARSEAPHLYIKAPTLQMAMKWLREVHKINIEIITYWTKDKSMVYGNRMVCDATLLKEIDVAYNSYEEACERAIKYCLENLI